MRLAAGVIAPLPVLVNVADATLVQFSLSPERLSETEIMDSALSSPGRYSGELLRRLRGIAPDAELYVAINPQVSLEGDAVEALLRRVAAPWPEDHAFTIFTDEEEGWPIAYALRAEAAARCPAVHLGLLTCSDAELDARLLRASVGEGRVHTAPRATLAMTGANGFLWSKNPGVASAARRAAAQLEALSDLDARRARVATGPRAAAVGFHAGDVLFVLQALALEDTRFDAIVVPDAYADFVQQVRPDLTCLAVHLPVPQRGAYQVADELLLLDSYVDQLALQGVETDRWFFHPLRPVFRDYNCARHHLREAAAFAVGGPGRPRRTPPTHGDHARARAARVPGRVVVQFDAGWALKSYPLDRRGELLDLLCASGYQPILLGAPEPARPDIAAQPYRDLAGFRALIDSADGLIACDSFPAHYAEGYGIPTVVLFGSTRPGNSRGAETPRYRFLHHPMTCVPCRQSTICTVDDGHSCHAHASPAEVLAALAALTPPPRPGAEAR